MTRHVSFVFTALAVSLLGASAALADATVTMNDGTLVQVRNGMARMAPGGDSTYMQYDVKRSLLIHVDPEQGTYMEIDEQTMKQQAEAVKSMRKEMAPQMEAMRAQMQNMPEAQRRMIEQRMGAMMGDMGGESAPKPDVKAVKKGSRKLQGFKCNDYQLLEGKTPVADACVAEKAGAGMSKDDFATLAAMMKFMRSMAAQAQEIAGSMVGGIDPLDMGVVEGFPVEVKDHRSGETYGVASVSNDTLSNSPFTEYKKLRKEEMPSMGGR
jgi:hypothetical protein